MAVEIGIDNGRLCGTSGTMMIISYGTQSIKERKITNADRHKDRHTETDTETVTETHTKTDT